MCVRESIQDQLSQEASTSACIDMVVTHVVDEFSLQEANRFKGEQVIHQEGVGVFESPNDTSEGEENI